MILFGHRGAAGLAPENTLASLRKGLEIGVDYLEFDVRVTKDGVPVLAHDFFTMRTHGHLGIVSRSTLAQLRARTPRGVVTTLTKVLDEFFGKAPLNIELKSRRAGIVVAQLLQEKYIKKPSDWDNLLFSSFYPSALAAIRRVSPRAKLALPQHVNTSSFVKQHRLLHLTAVGFFYQHIPPRALAKAKEMGLLTYVYTIDSPADAKRMAQKGIDGIITNRPDIIRSDINKVS